MGNDDYLIGIDRCDGPESEVDDAMALANLIVKSPGVLSSDPEIERTTSETDDFPCPSEAPLEESKSDHIYDGNIFDFGFLTRPGCFDDDEEDGESDDGDNSVVSHDSDDSELADHLKDEYDTASETSSAHIDKSESSLAKQYRSDRLLYAALRSSQSKRSSTEIKTHKKKNNKRTDKRTAAQQICCDNLKVRWMARSPEAPLSDDMILRFALAAPSGRFHENSAWKRMKRFDRRYLTLTAKGLEKQLLTKTLFPVPGIETKEGNQCFYMRPSRYFPKETTVTEIIDNQCYVMNTLNEIEYNATNGIGFIANMDNWKFDNFEVKYCFCFMMALQGRAVPTTVTHFLIVNPPAWFGKIWSIMKTMLAPSFQKKVKMIPESDLPKYLKPGFEQYLPDDMASGRASTEKIVADFIAERKKLERSRRK